MVQSPDEFDFIMDKMLALQEKSERIRQQLDQASATVAEILQDQLGFDDNPIALPAQIPQVQPSGDPAGVTPPLDASADVVPALDAPAPVRANVTLNPQDFFASDNEDE